MTFRAKTAAGKPPSSIYPVWKKQEPETRERFRLKVNPLDLISGGADQLRILVQAEAPVNRKLGGRQAVLQSTGAVMAKERYFCEVCPGWFEVEVLSRSEAEEAIRRGIPLGPPRCPRGHILYRKTA